jgi:hypothetical protein
MPPLVWGLRPDDAQSILAAFADTIHAGLAVARPLPAVIAETAGDPAPPTPLDPDPAESHPASMTRWWPACVTRSRGWG